MVEEKRKIFEMRRFLRLFLNLKGGEWGFMGNWEKGGLYWE